MLTGDIKKIELTKSSFKDIISNGSFYVDKTRIIESFLISSNSVHLVARQRRLGKTLNMDTLRCFLTDKEDLRHLFKKLYVEKSPVWELANSAPVFYFDFKTLTSVNYKNQVVKQVYKHICSYVAPDDLKGYSKMLVDDLANDAENCLKALTEIVYEATGKRSYILIDEYDKLLMESYDKASYEEIRSFMTALFSSAVKSNEYLEKALLTGVMRISHESMFSGLNNIVTYDVFRDKVYKDDFGFTDEEVEEIGKLADFDQAELRQWYNGVRIDGKPIYNTYSVMSFLQHRQYDCFWGKSGTMDIIRGLLDDGRLAALAKLLGGESAEVPMADRVSLSHLTKGASDQAYYSLLVQAGYFALVERTPGKPSTSVVSIPNTELMLVWKDFILENLYPSQTKIRTLFDNIGDTEAFRSDFEHFLSDRLSYHDLRAQEGEAPRRHNEKVYHVFLLGLLSAYEDTSVTRPASNRESGGGRFDLRVERPEANAIIELKACEKESDLEKTAEQALAQISAKRYGEDLDKPKRLVKVGVAFFGKQVCVKCE